MQDKKPKPKRCRPLPFYVTPVFDELRTSRHDQLSHFNDLMRVVRRWKGERLKALFTGRISFPLPREYKVLLGPDFYIPAGLSGNDAAALRHCHLANRAAFLLCSESEYSVRELVSHALYVIELLEQVECDFPSTAGKVRRSSGAWPVKATLNPDWYQGALQRTKDLGDDMERCEGVRLRKKAFQNHGPDNTARRHARALLLAVELNRRLALEIQGQEDKFRDWVDKRLRMCSHIPDWLSKCSCLPDLKGSTLDKWYECGRTIAEALCPKFWNAPSWHCHGDASEPHRYRLQVVRSARVKSNSAIDTAVKNRVYDNIKNAMETIIPLADDSMPENLLDSYGSPPASIS